MRSWLCPVANRLWNLANGPAYHRYAKALRDPMGVQNALLAGYLMRGAETVFGRDHRLGSVNSVKAFQERVPIRGYDELAPYIGRVALGESGILTTEKVERLATTSGSTRARKLIPYTRRLQGEFNRAIGPWMGGLFAARPELMSGSAYWSITPVGSARKMERLSPEGPPIGFEEDSAYLGGVYKYLIDQVMAVPGRVRLIQEMEVFRHVTARWLLAREDLTIISVWHPSFLDLIMRHIRGQWDVLCKEIHDGVRSDGLGGDPPRARQLGGTDPSRPKSFWPRLGLVSAWSDANAQAGAAAMAEGFAGVLFEPKGLLATEAFFTLPFRGRHPLAMCSHFFEFLGEDGSVYLADQLREGARYQTVVTTGGGLWRYRTGDVVQVDGWVDRTPSLRLVGREDHVSDLFGEKLSEGFVAGVITTVLGKQGCRAPFAMLAPQNMTEGVGYVLYLEAPGFEIEVGTLELEAGLFCNPHYAYCRQLGQLIASRVEIVKAGAYERYTGVLLERGMRLGDIKPAVLSREEGWSGRL